MIRIFPNNLVNDYHKTTILYSSSLWTVMLRFFFIFSSDENILPFPVPGPAVSEPDLYERVLTDREGSENTPEVTKLHPAFSINQRIQAAVIEADCYRNRMPTSASNRLRLLSTFKRPRSVDSYLAPPPQNDGHLDQSIQITNLPNMHHAHKPYRKRTAPIQRYCGVYFNNTPTHHKFLFYVWHTHCRRQNAIFINGIDNFHIIFFFPINTKNIFC